jgi:hypothetical protein
MPGVSPRRAPARPPVEEDEDEEFVM